MKLNALKNDAKIWPILDLYEICSTIYIYIKKKYILHIGV